MRPLHRRLVVCGFFIAILTGCHRNNENSGSTLTPPAGQITSPLTTGASTSSSANAVPPGSPGLIIYDDELHQGAAFLYPGAGNQTLTFNNQDNSVSGNSARYSWNGQTVQGQHSFAGFD